MSTHHSIEFESSALTLPLTFSMMALTDLDHVAVIENAVYSHPWTHGNFVDSLNSAYVCWVLRDTAQRMVGYFFLMPVVDEMHLLNISVDGNLHGQGIGRIMLDKVVVLTRESNMTSVLLEVRPSNTRAMAIYARYGFTEIGLRRAYYPAAGDSREDAIVMRLSV